MRPPADPRSRALAVLAAITPFALVFALRELTSVERPAAAAAQPAPSPAPIVAPPPPAPPTTRQTRALEWVRAHQSFAALPDPMARPQPPAPEPASEPTPTPPTTPTVVVTPAPAPDAPAMPAWTVSGLMGQGPEAVAIINDRIVRIGDDVGSGWMLVEVDARARTATLRHADGRRAELTQVLPTPR
jgi:hypothetical protein